MILLKSNKNIHGINIFNHDFLYAAYADGTTFFLKDFNSINNVLEMLNQFYMVSELRPNLGGTLWTEKFRFNQREH